MYLKKQLPKEIYLAIQESAYNSSRKKSRAHTVESLGYLDDLKSQYDNSVFFYIESIKNDCAEKERRSCFSYD